MNSRWLEYAAVNKTLRLMKATYVDKQYWICETADGDSPLIQFGVIIQARYVLSG